MRKNYYDMIFYAIGIFAGGFLLYALYLTISGLWSFDGESFWLYLILALVCVGSIASGRGYAKANKKYAEKMKIAQEMANEDAHKNTCRNFYNECVKNEIKHTEDFMKPLTLEKAKLIGKELGIDEEKITNYFAEGESIVGKDKAAKEEHEKLVAKNNFMIMVHEINKNQKYKNYHGREKTIKMLEEMISVELSQVGNAKKVVDGIVYTENMMSEKEVAWGWTGGIAAGIAGGAAGLAAAAATEARNAEARAYNEQLHSSLIEANLDNYLAASQEDSYHRERAEKLTKSLEKAKLAVIMSENKERIFNEIGITLGKFEILEYGYVKADICLKGDIFSKDKYFGVIDGSIKVSAMSDGKEIGSSCVVLPWNGLGDKTITLTTMIECNEKVDNDVYFEYTYNDLWIIEAIDK